MANREEQLAAMLRAAGELRRERTDNIEYNLAMLRYFLFEAEIILPSAFAEIENQPVITPDWLDEIERDYFDRLAQIDLQTIENPSLMGEDPDIVLTRLKRNNNKGHRKISAKEILGLNEALSLHRVQVAEKKWQELQRDIAIKPFFVAKLVEYMEENVIPYELISTTKENVLALGLYD